MCQFLYQGEYFQILKERNGEGGKGRREVEAGRTAAGMGEASPPCCRVVSISEIVEAAVDEEMEGSLNGLSVRVLGQYVRLSRANLRPVRAPAPVTCLRERRADNGTPLSPIAVCARRA